MSALQTDTLEANDNVSPAEALEVETSTPSTKLDSFTSTTEVTKTDKPTETAAQAMQEIEPESGLAESVGQNVEMAPQTNLTGSTKSKAEKSTLTVDIEPAARVTNKTNNELVQQETQPVNHKDTEITEEQHSNPEQSLVAISENSHTIKDNALNEAQSTSPTNTVTVATTESATQPIVSPPFNTDWLMVLVFLLTAAFLLLTNRKQIQKTYQLAQLASRPVMPTPQPTIDVKFEKAKVVAESRQHWIHALREEVANFVSATNAIWDLHKIKDGCEDILTDMNDPQFVMKELYHWSCTYNKAVQDTEQLYTKIHLLINPNEEKAQTLCKLLDRTMVAIEAKKSPSKSNDDIIAVTQEILKDEWERVKTFN